MSRRHGVSMNTDKPKNFKQSLKRLINYLGAYRYLIIVVWVFAIAATVFTIVGPKILGQATDELFSGMIAQLQGSGGIDFDRIGTILWRLILLYCVSALMSYIQGFIMATITADVTKRLRTDLNDKIHRLPLSYFDTKSQGDVLSHITNDVDTLNQSLSQGITQIITAITSLIGILIMMLSISWQLTLVTLITLPTTMVVVMMIVKRSQGYFAQQQESLGRVNGHVEEMLGSHVIVKAFNGEKTSMEIFEKGNSDLYESAWKSNFLSSLMIPVVNIVSNISYVAICVLGGYLAVRNAITVGGLQAFIQYVRQFNQPISQVASLSNVFQQTAAASERIFEFMDAEEEVRDADDAIALPTGLGDLQETAVVFDQVGFGYYPDTPVINDFSCTIKAGQKVAIVGPTGAGKTTIVKLLMRFYDVNKGAIYVNGQNIQHYVRDDLRRAFGMVLQDTWLYSGTILDNIRYGNLNCTDEDVYEAAKTAQVDHFVRTLPHGYQTLINEEATNISQGQKQLLTIARAILANPEILILDEATSSIDTRTEMLIQKAMDHLVQGRTSFVIAHRLSTIKNADVILVMEHGDIVEQGTHEGLLAKGGAYARLYNAQFEEMDA